MTDMNSRIAQRFLERQARAELSVASKNLKQSAKHMGEAAVSQDAREALHHAEEAVKYLKWSIQTIAMLPEVEEHKQTLEQAARDATSLRDRLSKAAR